MLAFLMVCIYPSILEVYTSQKFGRNFYNELRLPYIKVKIYVYKRTYKSYGRIPNT